MSVWDESYEDRRAKQREEQHEYQSSVFYEVWRSGGNPDRINDDRVSDHYNCGDPYEAAAMDELARQRPKPTETEQEHPEQQEPEE